ncbi:unnamed protein product [Phytophthora fragariaefolia]|uniref:Unnamed protein product n=1 Tax=Phytophthora fragariaefolia TaxID=1490495 RepID=A0A9W6XAZ9_9STRA|nr:unnamed protein product [Phytophthora fragariaefolia]
MLEEESAAPSDLSGAPTSSDGTSEAAELEQKMPVPAPVIAQAKTGMDDDGEVESHTAAHERGSGDAPSAKNAGAGG